MKRLFDWNPDTGETQWYEYDHEEKVVRLTTTQDVSGFLELNKVQQNDIDRSRKGIKESWWHIGRIPNAVIMKWKTERGVDVFNKDHWPAVKRLLNDPEWRFLRTSPGRV